MVGSVEGQAVALAHDYLEKFVSEHTHYLSSRFIGEALDLLRNVSGQQVTIHSLDPRPSS